MNYYITLSRPYAKAIFNLAIKTDTIQDWNEQLFFCSEISKELFKNKKYNNYFNNEILFKIFVTIGEKHINQKTKNLIKIMAKNKRLILFPNIFNFFCNLKNNYNNIINLEIVSSFQLELKILNIVHERLLQYFSKKIIFKHTIDNSIIGGLIIKIDDQIIDCSILNQIKKLNNILNF
ncbi:ATP synthase subunit delta [Buchnera aphidicola (Eriosoma grossulariae)]|uniref:F0F1 ATP synthase subunit delta n=1 Tax=Buchnera aphidicola TaxID=9 RepID=UPI0034643C50